MTVLMAYSSTADDTWSDSTNATYLTARAGSSVTPDSTGGFLIAGQDTGFTCTIAYARFDTSALPDTANIVSVIASLFDDGTGAPAHATTIEMRLFDWGAGAAAAGDWIAGANWTANTLLASRSTTGWVASKYNVFAQVPDVFIANINRTGNTNIVISSDEFGAGTSPTGLDTIHVFSADAAGTTTDPKLAVAYDGNDTRFYLPSASAAVPNSPGFAAWTRTTEGDRLMMYPRKTGSAMANKTAWANTAVAANGSALFRQYQSQKLSVGIAFATTDTIKGYIRCLESAANDNVNRQPICLKVYNGTTLQATLKALGHIGPLTTEWDTGTAESRTLADGDTLDANYTTVKDDYLVLEIGGQVSSAAGTSVTGTLRFGDSAAADVDETETDIDDDAPWFEISRKITFDLGPPYVSFNRNPLTSPLLRR